ncbi:hypothetical protein NKH77_35315 [Streptomyces sp. M19]
MAFAFQERGQGVGELRGLPGVALGAGVAGGREEGRPLGDEPLLGLRAVGPGRERERARREVEIEPGRR